MAGVTRGRSGDRVVATLLFTDIVSSTELAVRLGDRKWRELLVRHNREVRDQLDRYRGREVNTTGDGFLAVFDGAARAIHAALAIRERAQSLDLEIRVGVHTGEVEIEGQTLHEDDQLILLYPSANRDDRVFDDPYRLDVRREPNPHLAFGFGTHFCLGASLARLELNVMFDELSKRLPDIELATDAAPLPFRASNFIVGPEAMPVTFTPTPRST